MAYTCSWFNDGSKTLEEAPLAKMDHVCRKVLLKRGETCADIGSGWGNLLFDAWEKYRAHGMGINATTEQVEETRAEIKAIDWCERCGLEVVDIENLRRNYALTLDDWARRFDRNWERVHKLDPGKFDEKFRRIWRTYLCSCAEMFRSPADKTHLFQIVVSKGNIGDNYPMGRAFLYTSELPRGQARPAAR